MDWKTRIPAFLLWIFLLLSSIENGNAEQRIVCYYTNWSVYRPGTAKFSPQNINPYLCTHLIYAFGGFTKDNTLKPFDKYQDIEKGGYAKFTGLKTYNKDLKTMLAIGGWNEGSSRFSPMVADPDRRKDFVKNSIKFLRQNHFDGLDLDWEYPAFRDGGKPRDKNNYADLVQELREEFERESSKTGRPRLLLSMAVPAGIEYIDKGYDIPRLNDYLDFINLLSYDYHSAYEPAANHHSPLYPLEEDNEYNYDTELTIDYTIEHLLKSGASSEKIVLGIPTYGRSYTLFNEDATDIGAPADGPGEEGEATREKGYLAYYEICESIGKTDEWEVVQPNPNAMGPYAYRGNQWVGYDDENIVRAKARYVNEKKLGGIMFWSIDNDDFRGKCHGRPYPLIEAAKEALLIDDEKSNSGTKTRLSDNNRKKTRNQGGQKSQGSSTGRKFKAGRRSTTTESSLANRRFSSSRTNGRFKARVNSRDNENNEENEEEEVNSVKSVERSRSGSRVKDTRSKNRLPVGGRRKQQNPRKDDEKKSEDSTEDRRSNKLTTPEPPTTPDPGTDFKCEDEGFFSHPRDCKKYFWCLDSGPGGLGIVAHQFTCPSGLVFNKAADSCDYPRNVVCPKTKTSQNIVTTTREPITAATSRTTYLHKPTQRTTTSKIESEEEYEYYDEDDDEDVNANDSREIEEEVRSTTTAKTYKTINRSRPTTTSAPTTTTTETSKLSSTRSYKTPIDKATSFEDEEDPRVIKELIDLIKKAGGIEQLEKQLHYQEKNSGSNSDKTDETGQSTPATISRSLYERVLNRQATKITGGLLGSLSRVQSSIGDKSEQSASTNSRSGFVNGPGGAQFEGLDEVPEVKSLRRTTKHQYVTIDRQRHSTSESPTDDDEEINEEDDDDNRDVASSEDETVSNSPQDKSFNRRVIPNYVDIRRPRPTARTENDVEVKDEDEENSEESEENAEKEEEENHRMSKTEEESSSPKSRYTNAQRFRSTTTRGSSEKVTERAAAKNYSTTSTTTEKVATITENNSDISVTLPTSLQSQFDNLTIKYNDTLEEKLLTVNPETTETGNESTLSLVENSATEILLTTVPVPSISAGSNYDTFTSEPSIPVVSQPRPFGFSRRGRPTTSSSTTSIPTTVASVTEQTRSKVDLDTLRLPTLKELVGLTTTLLNDESASELPQPSTTYRVTDTTVDINAFRDESDYRGYQKNNVDYDDKSRGGKNNSDPDGPSLESTIDREIFDNDILSSEEIQNRSPSTSFVNVVDENTNQSSNHDDTKLRNTVRRVEVPVKILDDTNGEEVAELVLLRLPENKLNSAILKPVFRVKILEREVQEHRNGGEGTKKNENSLESSLENELADNFRSNSENRRKTDYSKLDKAVEKTTGVSDNVTNRPRSRQRIVKARRRTRPLISNQQHDELTNVRSRTSEDFQDEQVRKTSMRDKNMEISVINKTTVMPNLLEISTTIRPTTKRGNHSSSSKLSNATRGFYVTKNIDETSVSPDFTTADFVESTQFSATRLNDISYDTTQEIDLTTQISDFTMQKIDLTTQISDFTMQNVDLTTDRTDLATSAMDFTKPIAERATPERKTIYSTTEESTTLMKSTVSTVINGETTLRELETVTPDSFSTMENKMSDSPDPSSTSNKGRVIEKSEMTTFRPWTTEQPLTTIPTISIEPTTLEYEHDASTVIGDNYIIADTEETVRNVSEILITSENSQWGSSKPVETKNTISPLEALKNDKNIESKRERSKDEGVTLTVESSTVRNNVNRNSVQPRFESKTTTIAMKSITDKNNENGASQTEISLPETANYSEESTTHKGSLNRGGIRYTTSKPTQFIGSSLEIRGQSRKSAKASEVNDNKNTSTDEQFVPVTMPGSIEPYDKTMKSTRSEEITRFHANFVNRSISLPPNSRSTLRERNNFRKTTKALDISQKKSSPTYPVTTEAYGKIDVTVNDDSTSTTNQVEESLSRAQTSRSFHTNSDNDSRTTRIFRTDASESYTSASKKSTTNIASSTEAYDKTVKVTSANGVTTYPMRNPEKETEEQTYPSDSKTTESLENVKTQISTKHQDESLGTIAIPTESYVGASLSDENAFTNDNFELDAANKSFDPKFFYPRSFEDRGSVMNSTNRNKYSMTTTSDFSDDALKQSTDISQMDYLTTNYVETTLNSGESGLALQNFDSYTKTTRSFGTDVMDNKKVYNENIEHGSTSAQLDYSTMNSIEENDIRFYTTIISDQTGEHLTTTEAYDKTSERTYSVKTTANYDETTMPWLKVQRNTNINDPSTSSPLNSNDTATSIKLKSFNSTTTEIYPTTDFDEYFTRTYDSRTDINDQTVPEVSRVFDKISSTLSFDDEKNNVTTEPNISLTKITFTSIIYNNSTDTTDVPAVERKMTNVAKSTTPIYEKHDDVAKESAKNFQQHEIERGSKRTRGRIRFTNFAANTNDTNELNRRPVKQVVVRRRLAKDRYQNATTMRPKSTPSGNSMSGEHKNNDDVYFTNKRRNNDNRKNEDNKIEDAKKIQDTLNNRFPDEIITSPKTTRRRIVVYRGKRRPETVTAFAIPTTTTVQSSTLSSNEITDDKKRRRRKWRKKIVLKREKVNVEPDDQSIAETNDFERALMNDEHMEEFHDEFSKSYVVAPPEIEKISNREEILREVNLLKNSGSFLRRPGTLVRNDALNRLRSKISSTSVPNTQATSPPPFSKIQSTTDAPYELKTDDQSVRAQELAVTLSDPPGIIDSSSTIGRLSLRKQGTRKISTTVAPQTEAPSHQRTTPMIVRRRNNNTGKGARNDNSRIIEPHRPIRQRRPSIIDYDYYVDDEIRLVLKPELKDKLYVTKKGGIRCLDQGNFAHPTSCKKFITCARMVNGQVIGTEYTCPDKLSFDPVGGICNWSAGLGCEEKNKSSK